MFIDMDCPIIIDVTRGRGVVKLQDKLWDVLLAVFSAWLGAKFATREEDKRARKRGKHFKP